MKGDLSGESASEVRALCIERGRPEHDPGVLLVVAAVLIRQGRVLLQQRAATGAHGWLWESPGGKVESGETADEALARELREELAVDAWGFIWIGSVVCRVGEKRMRIAFAEVRRVRGELRPLQAEGMGWFTPAMMRDMRSARALTPANAAMCDALSEWIRVDTRANLIVMGADE